MYVNIFFFSLNTKRTVVSYLIERMHRKFLFFLFVKQRTSAKAKVKQHEGTQSLHHHYVAKSTPKGGVAK